VQPKDVLRDAALEENRSLLWKRRAASQRSGENGVAAASRVTFP
jgi:hypothetical protein